MPIVYYDIVRGRSCDQIRALHDSAQAALMEAFEVPESDRFQIVTEHSPDEMIILDRGVGIERSEDIVVLAAEFIADGSAASGEDGLPPIGERGDARDEVRP